MLFIHASVHVEDGRALASDLSVCASDACKRIGPRLVSVCAQLQQWRVYTAPRVKHPHKYRSMKGEDLQRENLCYQLFLFLSRRVAFSQRKNHCAISVFFWRRRRRLPCTPQHRRSFALSHTKSGATISSKFQTVVAASNPDVRRKPCFIRHKTHSSAK